MRNVHHPGGLTHDDLVALRRGDIRTNIDDMEFFETLARARCLVMPPWVYYITVEDHLEKITPVRYTAEYSLDKPAMLLAVMERLPQVQHGQPSRAAAHA